MRMEIYIALPRTIDARPLMAKFLGAVSSMRTGICTSVQSEYDAARAMAAGSATGAVECDTGASASPESPPAEGTAAFLCERQAPDIRAMIAAMKSGRIRDV